MNFESIPCDYCGAAVGEPCVTRSGNPAHMPHSARLTPLLNAYSEGYMDGEAFAQRCLTRKQAAS